MQLSIPDASWHLTLEGLRAGDRSSIEHIRRVVRRCHSVMLTRDEPGDWEDLAQDVMLTLLCQHDAETPQIASAAYVRMIAQHACVDRLRRSRGRRRIIDDGTLPHRSRAAWRRDVPLEHAGSLEAPPSREQRLLEAGLSEGLAALDNRVRRAVLYKYVLGCSDGEACRALGESFGTYRRLLRRGLEALRESQPAHGEARARTAPASTA